MRIRDGVFIFFSMVVIMWISSCKADGNRSSAGENLSFDEVKSSSGPMTPSAGSEPEAEKPKIVFLNYSVKRNSGGDPEVRFINKIIAGGKIKEGFSDHQEATVGDFKAVELDGNHEPVKSIIIPNPLTKVAEYVNDSGELTKQTFSLDSAAFSIRMQLDASTEAIAIEQINASGSGTTNLIVTKLK